MQSLELPRVVVQMSTKNSPQEPVASLSEHKRKVRHIQRGRVVAHILIPLSNSFLKIPDDMKSNIRGKHFYSLDSGKEDRNFALLVKQSKV